MSSVRVFPSVLMKGSIAVPGVVPASQLQRPAPPTVPTGVAAVDELTGGLPRGGLSEIVGPASSGRTSLMISALAARTAVGETCALVDTSDAFDPESAQAAGVDLRRVLWVRCGGSGQWSVASGQKRVPGFQFPVSSEAKSEKRMAKSAIRDSEQRERSNVQAAVEAGVLVFDADHEYNAQAVAGRQALVVGRSGQWSVASGQKEKVSGERPRTEGRASSPSTNSQLESRIAKLSSVEQALRATDFLLQAGGFGMVIVDLADVDAATARRIPLTSWFRFRRAVEATPTVLVVVEREPFAKQCASLVLSTQQSAVSIQSARGPGHTRLLHGISVDVEVLRAPGMPRKAPRGVRFETAAQWRVG